MKPEEIERDRAVIAAATPGPWIHEGGRMIRCRPGGDTVPMRTTEDARFAVAAITRWPAALDALEARNVAAELSAASLRQRLQRHQDNLAGWQEPGGYLVPTEPDGEERRRVRDGLRAAIDELGWVLKVLGGGR